MKQIKQPKAETKVEVLCRRLHEIALEKGANAQMPTVRTLCEELSTTRVTLDEALNILEAKNILYRRQRMGIFVSPKIHHKTISILFDGSLFGTTGISPIWNMLWVQIAQEAQLRSGTKNESYTFHLMIPGSDGSSELPDEVKQGIETHRIHAVLAIGLQNPVCSWITDHGIPCVVFAGIGSHVTCLHLDAYMMQRLAVATLKEQGCQRLGFWFPNWSATSREEFLRFEGVYEFQQALAEAGLPYYPELVNAQILSPLEVSSPFSRINQKQGYQLALEVFGNPEQAKPDGLFIGDDMVTDGALAAFEELGLHVGNDLKVVTHANAGSPILFSRTKNMAVVEFDPHEIVQVMFSSLDDLLLDSIPKSNFLPIQPKIRLPLER
ncbi:GntR family transcriptional regulator [Tengunoibacter tsumagoiensis]|uniref:HTH gntR-type domain-containing protein n=1 Tax=Tengunoibacter tsumagoiensis TaxID=2014871 RepID=A0A402A5A6_9CHLR|nr:substrate-binding domain-containing protein [Tengunoibacter tsumagoiensis]GCE14327.1 hypothetical protein KTT_41860 [Tengunoibacter tsumagoiensis]